VARGTIARSTSLPTRNPSRRAISAFAHEIDAIRSDASRVLGSTAVDVKAISVPYHWNSTAQHTTLSAATVANVPLAGIHMLLRYPRALDNAYHLESSLAADDYLSLVVDYNRSYLHPLICETVKDGGYALVESQVQLPHLGEDAVSKGEPGQHYGRISEALEKFVYLTAAKEPSSSTGGFPYNDAKAVVLGGEASSEAMRLMHDVLQQIFADLGKGALFDSLDPLYLGSMGAARAAKSQVDNPKTTCDFISMPDYIPDEPKAS